MAAKARDTDELLSTMRDRLRTGLEAWSPTRRDQLSDQRFAAGSPDNNWQWPAEVVATRGDTPNQTARPTLTINKLPQHVRQITNDQRQNRPGGNVIPVDDKGDPELAEALEGIVRHVEAISDSDVAIDTACENQVTHGEGYIRILTEFTDPRSFDQDIRIGRVRNAFAVVLDPLIQDPCGADAEWGFVLETLSHAEYMRQWPKAAPMSSLTELAGTGDSQDFVTEATVRIAEYFYAEYDAKTLNLYPNNQAVFADSPEDKTLAAQFGKPLRSRETHDRRICWIKTNGYEVLEETTWPGKWVPLVRVVGNEFEVDGEISLSGIVRNAKDAQRMYNYWASQEAEMLALAPKAPFIGYLGQFEGVEKKWRNANVVAYPYLEVNPKATDAEGRVLPIPQRSQPPMAQEGLIRAKMGASEDIKDATGQYNAALGMTSNERSAKAITARDRQSDTSTYHYADNLGRAVRYVTRQIVDLIPKIYDTARIARIIGQDGETDMVHIDPTAPQAVTKVMDAEGNVIRKIYNPTIGKYDVRVETGPSYMTKRQEARESMSEILRGNPELWGIAGDLFVENMDWPGAKELAKRLKRSIDPKFTADEDDPALSAANKQIEAMGQQMEQMHQMLQRAQSDLDAREVNVKEFEAKVKAFDAETKRLAAMADKMSPDAVQEIVLGTLHSMMASGDLSAGLAAMEQQAQPPAAPPNGGMPA